MNPYLRKCSATNLFLLPLLKMDRGTLVRLGLVGAYIKDELGMIDYEDCIFLLFKPTNVQNFNLFTEEYRNRIVDEYDRSGHVILVFKLPEKFRKDIDTVMTGKFSKTSKEYQQEIPTYVKMTGTDGQPVDEMTIQHKIFKKEQEVKDYWKDEYDLKFEPEDEVWEFYPEREILNDENLKKIYGFNTIP